MEKEPRRRLRDTGFFWMADGLFHRYHHHDVAQQGAALAYYVLFALFPILVFVSSLLGMLHLNVEDTVELLATVLPSAVVELCRSYLSYAAAPSNTAVFWLSLIFSIYFPMRAANCLMRSVRRAYGVKRPTNLIRYYARLLLFTVILILVIILSLVLITVGQRLLLYLAGHIHRMEGIIRLWNYLRFVLLAAILFATLGLLYALSNDERQQAGAIIPGALIALTAWMALSVGFSFYVENFADYSLLYGALGTVIVLLIWLFLSAVALIMGAEFNGLWQLWQERRNLPPSQRPGGLE